MYIHLWLNFAGDGPPKRGGQGSRRQNDCNSRVHFCVVVTWHMAIRIQKLSVSLAIPTIPLDETPPFHGQIHEFGPIPFSAAHASAVERGNPAAHGPIGVSALGHRRRPAQPCWWWFPVHHAMVIQSHAQMEATWTSAFLDFVDDLEFCDFLLGLER